MQFTSHDTRKATRHTQPPTAARIPIRPQRHSTQNVYAGSVCWFAGGTTDSFGLPLRPVTDGLGFLPFSNRPHHDAEEQRRPAIHRLIGEGTLPDGYATDDGTGLVFEGTELVDCVTEVDGARTWHMTRHPDGTVNEVALPTRLLSP